MDAIKKKMQAMKLEKENAFDKADQLEQKLNEQKTVFEQVRTTCCRRKTISLATVTLTHFSLPVFPKLLH